VEARKARVTGGAIREERDADEHQAWKRLSSTQLAKGDYAPKLLKVEVEGSVVFVVDLDSGAKGFGWSHIIVLIKVIDVRLAWIAV